MNQYNSNNSATFINFVNHTNSSVAESVVFTSARNDNEAAITKNQTILIGEIKNHSNSTDYDNTFSEFYSI